MKIAIITKDTSERTIYFFNKLVKIVNNFSKDVEFLNCDTKCDNTIIDHIDRVIFHDFIILIGKREADISIHEKIAIVSNTVGEFVFFSDIVKKMQDFQTSEFIFS